MPLPLNERWKRVFVYKVITLLRALFSCLHMWISRWKRWKRTFKLYTRRHHCRKMVFVNTLSYNYQNRGYSFCLMHTFTISHAFLFSSIFQLTDVSGIPWNVLTYQTPRHACCAVAASWSNMRSQSTSASSVKWEGSPHVATWIQTGYNDTMSWTPTIK